MNDDFIKTMYICPICKEKAFDGTQCYNCCYIILKVKK